MQSRIKRTFADLQDVLRQLFDAFGDGIAMHASAARQDAQDERVQAAE